MSEPFLGGAKLRFLNTLHSALDSPQMRVTLLTKPACLGLLEADHSWTESWQGRENQPRIYFPCVREATALFNFRISRSARCGAGGGVGVRVYPPLLPPAPPPGVAKKLERARVMATAHWVVQERTDLMADLRLG